MQYDEPTLDEPTFDDADEAVTQPMLVLDGEQTGKMSAVEIRGIVADDEARGRMP